MKSFDDMYFVALLFSYGAELDKVVSCESKKEFSFVQSTLNKLYVLENGLPTLVDNLGLDEMYSYYQRRKLLYPPNFPDGRRRFLELLHAKE